MRVDLAMRVVVSAIAALIVSASALAASAVAPAMTVATFPGFARSFDYDHGRAAWIDAVWTLHVRNLRTGFETKGIYTSQYEETWRVNWNNPFEEFHDVPWDRHLVLEQRRLLWVSSRGCMGGPPGATLCEHIYTGTDAPVAHRVPGVDTAHGDGGDGTYLTGIAADAQGFSYGSVDVVRTEDESHLQVVDGGIWSVAGGTARKLDDVPPAFLIARGAGRIAIEPADTSVRPWGEPAGDGTVEIRDARTGGLVSTLSPGKVRALVLTPTVAVMLVGGRVVRYGIATGRLLGSTAVPTDTVSDLGVDGSRVVLRTANAVKVLDAGTGRVSTVATTPAPWRLTRVAIDGGTVAWTESRRTAPGAVSRKTFETRIRTAPV